MAKKKTAPKSAPAPVAVPAPAAVDDKFSLAFTPAEAKKLAKLLKASDRGKRLDAIRVVSENHGYIAAGGCLLPLLESVVAKKKMEDVVQAAAQVYRPAVVCFTAFVLLHTWSRLPRALLVVLNVYIIY